MVCVQKTGFGVIRKEKYWQRKKLSLLVRFSLVNRLTIPASQFIFGRHVSLKEQYPARYVPNPIGEIGVIIGKQVVRILFKNLHLIGENVD